MLYELTEEEEEEEELVKALFLSRSLVYGLVLISTLIYGAIFPFILKKLIVIWIKSKSEDLKDTELKD